MRHTLTVEMDELDKLTTLTNSALFEKAKEMGLQYYHKLKREELIKLIRDSPPPRPRYTGMRRRVILLSSSIPVTVGIEGEDYQAGLSLNYIREHGQVFPSISAAAKHFNVNPGLFGAKLRSKNVSKRNKIKLNGRDYSLIFEAYRLKKAPPRKGEKPEDF